MTMSVLSRNVALLAVLLGITSVVLFPVTFGPFQVTEGPASSLRALVDADLLIFCLCCLVVLLRQEQVQRLPHTNLSVEDAGNSPHPILALRC